MSYKDKINYTDKMIKPKLVESKIIEKMVKIQYDNKPIQYRIGGIILEFIKKNILYVSIFVLFSLLLLYRYNEVKNRKNRNKKYENTNESTEEKSITSDISYISDFVEDE
jgi:hypothetical protein